MRTPCGPPTHAPRCLTTLNHLVSPSATGAGAATPPLQEDNFDGFEVEEDEIKTPDDLTQCGEDLNDAIIAQMLYVRGWGCMMGPVVCVCV